MSGSRAVLPAEAAAGTARRARTLEAAGSWEAAGELYDRMFREGVAAGDAATLADATRSGGRVFLRRGQPEPAEELGELSLWIAERHGLAREAARADNMLAAIHHQRGELAEARRRYDAALRGARRAGDDELIGFACMNLGVIANVEGDLRAARAYYLECIGAAVRSGGEMPMMMAYNNLGMVSADLGEWMEAEVYFTRGMELAEQEDDRGQMAKLCANRAEPRIRVGDLEGARGTLERAEEIATAVRDDGVLVLVERWRGAIARAEEDHAAANVHLSRALLLAARNQLGIERAEVLEELARLRWDEAKPDEALSLGREARVLYLALGARRDTGRVQRLLAEWETANLVANWVPEA
jgi:tetratricopeptide (TPR) repeat protein